MDLLQPIFVNQSGETYEAGLGPDNSSYSLKDINNRIQTDIDSGLEDFLLFITPIIHCDDLHILVPFGL